MDGRSTRSTRASLGFLSTCAAGELEDHRTSIWIGNQEDPQFWDELVQSVPPIDVVIDDGSHVGRMQLEAFQSLWPYLAPGGAYIVEDMMFAYMDMASMASKETELSESFHSFQRLS